MEHARAGRGISGPRRAAVGYPIRRTAFQAVRNLANGLEGQRGNFQIVLAGRETCQNDGRFWSLMKSLRSLGSLGSLPKSTGICKDIKDPKRDAADAAWYLDALGRGSLEKLRWRPLEETCPE